MLITRASEYVLTHPPNMVSHMDASRGSALAGSVYIVCFVALLQFTERVIVPATIPAHPLSSQPKTIQYTYLLIFLIGGFSAVTRNVNS